jgi:RHS repeat-associated protein
MNPILSLARLSARSALARHAAGLLVCCLLGSGTAHAQTPQNTTYTFGYDNMGNLVTATDPRGQVTRYDYDEFGQLKMTTRPLPAARAVQPKIATRFDYRGKLESLTDPRLLQTISVVNGFGETVSLTSPDTGKTTSTFDANGNRVTRTDARNITTTYRYDALERLVREDFPNWTSNVFDYDGGTTGAPQEIGKLTRFSDESGNTVLTYDGFGRLSGKAQTVSTWNGSVKYAVGYSYGSAGVETGKLKVMRYPSGSLLTYGYDQAGRLADIVLHPADASATGTSTTVSITLLKAIAYHATGRVRGWAWGNSTDAKPNENLRDFDLDGRMSSYRLGNPATTGVQRTLGYDAAGRITTMTDKNIASAARTQTFDYDDLDRLVSAAGTSTYRYAYDASDNRIQLTIGATTHTLAISPGSNRLMSTTGPLPARSNQYDNAGNLLTDGTVQYTYSPRGRLIKVTNGSTVVQSRYNALGQRVEKSSGEAFVYDEAGHLIGEYDKRTGRMLREIVYLGDEPVALLTQTVTGTAPAQTVAPNVFYVYSDHLGTPRLITQATDGAIRWRWEQADPFGLLPPDENPSGLGVFTFNLRMPGQYYDRESGLFYNYFRDYDPQTGRYVQSDPIGLDGGINTYGYVGGNPLSLVDPDGLQAIPLPPPIVPATPGNPNPGLFPGNPTKPWTDIFKPSPYFPTWNLNGITPAKGSKICKSKEDIEACKKDADEVYANEMKECDAYKRAFGVHTWRACKGRAADRYAQALLDCERK